mmetsp:Transcript_4845/g.12099  ORF Transcript_4845/g.12099 Transcript_4845/m.12099 type:complete len:222 (+) Transcript_4845:3-668(+)
MTSSAAASPPLSPVPMPVLPTSLDIAAGPPVLGVLAPASAPAAAAAAADDDDDAKARALDTALLPSSGLPPTMESLSGLITCPMIPRRTRLDAMSSASSATARHAIAYVLTRIASAAARTAAASASAAVGPDAAATAASAADRAAIAAAPPPKPSFSSAAAATAVAVASSSSSPPLLLSGDPSAHSRSFCTRLSSVSGYWKPVTVSTARVKRSAAACMAGV